MCVLFLNVQHRYSLPSTIIIQVFYVALVHKKLIVEILFWMKWLDSGPLGLGLVVRLLRRIICGLGAPYGSDPAGHKCLMWRRVEGRPVLTKF